MPTSSVVKGMRANAYLVGALVLWAILLFLLAYQPFSFFFSHLNYRHSVKPGSWFEYAILSNAPVAYFMNVSQEYRGSSLLVLVNYTLLKGGMVDVNATAYFYLKNGSLEIAPAYLTRMDHLDVKVRVNDTKLVFIFTPANKPLFTKPNDFNTSDTDVPVFGPPQYDPWLYTHSYSVQYFRYYNISSSTLLLSESYSKIGSLYILSGFLPPFTQNLTPSERLTVDKALYLVYLLTHDRAVLGYQPFALNSSKYYMAPDFSMLLYQTNTAPNIDWLGTFWVEFGFSLFPVSMVFLIGGLVLLVLWVRGK